MRQLTSLLRKLLRFDHAVAGRRRDEALVAKECLVEPDERVDSLDDELVERAQHAQARPLPVDPQRHPVARGEGRAWRSFPELRIDALSPAHR